MPTPGHDCDIALIHPDVNGGQPVGFLLEHKPTGAKSPATRNWGPVVSIHREAYAAAEGGLCDVAHLWFTVLIADRLRNPNGSPHAESAAEMYANLLAIVLKHRDISLVTASGVTGGLHSSGHILVEAQYPAARTVTVQLTNRDMPFAPAEPSAYLDSAWVDEERYQGIRTWGNSYWRS